MRTANPALSEKTFSGFDNLSLPAEQRMTLMGTVHKTAVLLVLLVFSASITWKGVYAGSASVGVLFFVGMIGGLIFCIITCFKQTWAPVTAPVYALLEGLFIGAVSAWFERMHPGIVIQAVGLTLGTLFALLMAYQSGLVKATENFKLGVIAATGGIFIVYVVTFLLSLFGITTAANYIHGSGTFGICFSVFVVIIAALNLVLDFDFIENGTERGAPKYMEWVGAFGLIVTLVWLYIEILRLLAKLRSAD